MLFRKNVFYLFWVILLNCFFTGKTFAQDVADGSATPLSGNSLAASQFENAVVNYYTGMPSISVPLFNYSDQNGLSLGISLSYSSGGIRVNERPSSVGLGWNLEVGGSIVRTIRGMPDDYPWKGFLYAPSIPLDYRPNGSKYYHDSLDAQQDIFQYNINGRSGKFFIGKNNQIVTVPLSKLRITYKTSSVDSSIISFTIVTEEGVKYVFNELETARTKGRHKWGLNDCLYNSAWNLSYITTIFGADSIKFNYRGMTYSGEFGIGYTVYKMVGGSASSKYLRTIVSQDILSKKIGSISFPDKKIVSFIYDPLVKYDKHDFGLNSIHVSDSMFRYGYQFLFDSTGAKTRTFLTGLRYYTPDIIKPGYKFFYNSPHFAAIDSTADTLGNKRDHWGFYNAGVPDTNRIPYVAIIYPTGVSRKASGAAIASSISHIEDPSGGKTYYTFENNSVYRTYNEDPQCIKPDLKKQTSTSIHIRHVGNTIDSFTFLSPFSRFEGGITPFSADAGVIWSITNLDSSIVYASDTVSLLNLYTNHGYESFTVNNLSTGDYLFKTKLVTGVTISSKTLYAVVKWNNREPTVNDRDTVGGIRIKQIAHFDPSTNKTDTIATYKYEFPNGRSSGFIGVVPTYNHPYFEIKVLGDDINDYQYEAISSDPVNNVNYTQGSPVGYSRVEVIKGTPTHNLGKEVHIFSTLEDAGLTVRSQQFPFAPNMQEDWLIGLNKKTLVYDNAGRMVQQTENNYNKVTKTYNDSSFRSVKLGLISNLIENGDSTETYTGEYYYPSSGRANLISSTQTFYHSDGSEQIKTQQIEYDSNYNAIKVVSGYDQNRGLKLERRMYYPYHYMVGQTVGLLRDSGTFTVVATEDWITGDSNPRLLTASVTDFQQIGNGSIKPLAVYAVQSKKPLPRAIIDSFDVTRLIRDTTWFKKQQEFVSYDSKGNCLEVKNSISQQSNVVLMDYHNSIPIAKVSNAKISDVAYTSFESDGTGNWLIGSVVRTNDSAITGRKSYNLSQGSISKTGLDETLSYIITYWQKGNGTVNVSNATAPILTAEQNDWKFYTLTVSLNDNVTISGNGLIDELRLYPKDANMATSTVDPLIGVTSTCDANNTISYYEYDKANRLEVLRDKDKNIIKKYEYSEALITRNLDSAVQYIREAYWDESAGRYRNGCFKYQRYVGGMMGEGTREEYGANCTRDESAGWGLLPEE